MQRLWRRLRRRRRLLLIPGRGPAALLVAPAASYRTGAYLEAARRLRVRLVVASDAEHSLVPALRSGLRIDLGDPDAAARTVLGVAGDENVRAVLATDDAAVEVASRVAAALGLPANPPRAARLTRRKDLARAALAEAGLPVPWFRRVDLAGDVEAAARAASYPCVVKPLAMAASRGVIRADRPEELVAACARVAAIVSREPDPEERRFALLEGYLPGAEVAVEGMLREGRLRLLAVFDKPDRLEGPYFEETFYVTPSRHRPALLERLAARVAEACAAYGLREGPVHAEARLHGGEAWILEIAARTIGGDCARLLRFGAGETLETLVLRNALRLRGGGRPGAGAAGVLMLPTPAAGTLRRVQGVARALRVPGVEEVSIAVREGYEVVPLPEGGSYLGFVFARAGDPARVEAALREAAAHIDVVVAPAWPLVAGG